MAINLPAVLCVLKHGFLPSWKQKQIIGI